MTVSVQDTFSSATANGISTSFAYGFTLLQAGDLVVQLDGVVVSSGFTVSGIGNEGGGDVVFAVAPASGVKVLLKRVLPLLRAVDYQENGDLLAATVDEDMDRSWMALQQLSAVQGVTFSLPVDDYAGVSFALAPPLPGAYWRWRADGSGVEYVTLLDSTMTPVTALGAALLAEDLAAGWRSMLDVLSVEETLVSPALTGTPTAPTAAPGDNSSQLATTGFVQHNGTQTGVVAHYFGSAAPLGWLVRDGNTIGNADSHGTARAHADTEALFALIFDHTDNSTDGGAFALQDSSGSVIARTGLSAATAFASNCRLPLPDDRGLFDRGLDTGGAVDAGRVLGSYQDDMVGPHTHTYQANRGSVDPAFGSTPQNWAPSTGTTDSGTGTETRPKNRAYLPIIKL